MPKVIDLPTATSISYADYLIMESNGGGTKKIAYQKALPAKDNIQYAPRPASSSVASGSDTDLTSMTLSEGLWIVIGQMSIFNSIGRSYKIGVGISSASQDMQLGGGGATIVMSLTSGASIVHVSRIIAFSAPTTVYLVGTQASGSSQTINTYDTNMRAVRVG